MCFYNEYDGDWSAEVSEESEGPAESQCRCDECGTVIAAGEYRRHIYQQENECCTFCDEFGDDYNEEDPQDPATCDHNYGETFTYDCCQACRNLLKAIEQVEIEEGCPPDERQPALTMLGEELSELQAYGGDNFEKYRHKAVEMFPSLASHKFLQTK